MIVKEELIVPIIQALREARSCARCVLRFLGERNAVRYLCPEESVKKLSSAAEEEKPEVDPPPCTACLGLLQSLCNSSLAHQVSSTVKTQGYEFSSFKLSIKTPLSLFIREKSVYLYLKDKFGTDYTPSEVSQLPSVKEVIKWICGPTIGQELGVCFENKSEFKVNVIFTHAENEQELKSLAQVEPSRFQQSKRKKKDTRNQALYTAPAIEKALQKLKTPDQFRKFFFCPPKTSSQMCQCSEVFCSHGSVYVAGRYRKYSRILPQSPWLLDGERHLESSVEEKICDRLQECFLAEDHRFTAAGREDVDVRMLGDGRPFAVELINPHKAELNAQELRELQHSINSENADIGIRDLQMVSKDDCTSIKDAENNKTKKYSALIQTIEEVSPSELTCLEIVEDLVVAQKTPLRVLHRRNLAVRDKLIHRMSAEWIDAHHFRLHLCTQAGTYIKEFVHGDFGRSKPHLGSLINKETDILELDVESVDVGWPPRLEDEENGK